MSDPRPRRAAAIAFTPFRLADLTLRNRIVKTATYEGMVVDGLPSASLLRHHRDLARGGVAMTTVAYCAVADDGRTFANQMVMRAAAVPHFRALTDAVHAEGAAASLQLGHAGGFSKNAALRFRRAPLGPSFGINAYGIMKGVPFTFAMTRDEMTATAAQFVAAATLARDAGFDAVELHLGHGYLLSQFMSPRLNRRRDDYGGSLANRMRFPLAVVSAVRAALPAGFPVLAKMNVDDGVRGGLGCEDAAAAAQLLEAAGVTALVLSGGLVTMSPMFLLRGATPLREMIEVEESRLQKLTLRVVGPRVIRDRPFTPLFFLEPARRVRAAVRLPLVLVGGVKSLDEIETALGAGFELVAMGRALLHDPTLPSRYRSGAATDSGCVPCNVCMTEMDRAGGVCCARVPEQLERRAAEVRDRLHLVPCAGDVKSR